MKIEFVGLWARIVMPLASTSAVGERTGTGGGVAPGPKTLEKGGAGIGAIVGAVAATEPPSGMPRMPDSVFAMSSGSA